jgi:hypothetical protein
MHHTPYTHAPYTHDAAGDCRELEKEVRTLGKEHASLQKELGKCR